MYKFTNSSKLKEAYDKNKYDMQLNTNNDEAYIQVNLYIRLVNLTKQFISIG